MLAIVEERHIFFPAGLGMPCSIKVIGYALRGSALKKQLVDEPYSLRLLRDYPERIILALFKAEKMRVSRR